MTHTRLLACIGSAACFVLGSVCTALIAPYQRFTETSSMVLGLVTLLVGLGVVGIALGVISKRSVWIVLNVLPLLAFPLVWFLATQFAAT